MANTPKNLTPKARLPQAHPNVAPPAPSAQMPPQAAIVQKQVAPITSTVPAIPTDGGPSAEEMARIAARRSSAPPAGSQKMFVPQRVGWVRRWVNDSPGRISRFLGKGWDFAKNPETGENWSMVVYMTVGELGGRKGFVLEIPLQFYQEDDMVKQESLNAVDQTIYNGALNADPDDKRYVPESTPIKVETRIGQGSG